jgi:hypothetical protein
MIYDAKYHRQVSGFRFIHLSAQEFFCTSLGAQDNPLWTAESDANHIIATSCLEYLTYCLPAQPLGGNVGKAMTVVILDQGFPLCNYAAGNWIHHLHEATSIEATKGICNPNINEHRDNAFKAVDTFLRQKSIVMSWVEASYVFKHIIASSLLREWANSSVQKVDTGFDQNVDIQGTLEDAIDFSHYLEKLEDHWGEKLTKNPAIIWEDVTAFTPSRFLLANADTRVFSLLAETPTYSNISNSYLCKISENTPGGEAVGVLSIWPSRLVVPSFSERQDSYTDTFAENTRYGQQRTAHCKIC